VIKFWESPMIGGGHAKCEFSDGVYTVTAELNGKTLFETFRCTYKPLCGMDVADDAESERIAIKLIKELKQASG
jgi:hypothetical protein